MTRRPEAWNKVVTCELQRPSKKKEMVQYGSVNHPAAEVLQTVKGTISTISSDPAEVIPEADVIVLCMPVHQYRDALNRIAPYINRTKKDVFVGTVYGQAGFNWMVHEVERLYRLENVVAFALGLIPWICRYVSFHLPALFSSSHFINFIRQSLVSVNIFAEQWSMENWELTMVRRL